MKNNNKNSKQSKDEVTTLDPATPLGDSELSLLAETKKNKASKRKSSESVEDLSVKTDTVEPPRSSLKIKKKPKGSFDDEEEGLVLEDDMDTRTRT